MKIKEKLFWMKFRPNTLLPEKGKIPIILLPRIRKIVEKGIPFNLMFTGESGQGKSCLAEILTQDTNCLKINCSLKEQRGIDVVSEEVFNHIKNYSLLGKKGIKTVFLEEFDNSTPDMRKALRGFIEDYSDVVRFIACVNNINKLRRTEEDRALLSRFNLINFDPSTKEETEYLKKNQLQYLKSISKAIQFDLSDELLMKILNKNFPNFRATVQLLQEVWVVGDLETYESNRQGESVELYSFIMNGKVDLSEIYYYVTENYPKDKTEELLKILSRPFFKFILDNYPDKISEKGKEIVELSKIHNAEYLSTSDPEMHLMNYIIKLKQLF